jgi:ribokinase
MGARGSLIFTEKEVIRIPSVKPDKLEDPTGAGDSHRAGFLFAILKGYDIKTAGRIASTVASFTIEAPGAQTSLPNWEKVKERYEKFFKEKLE